jgi:hypothetical protein
MATSWHGMPLSRPLFVRVGGQEGGLGGGCLRLRNITEISRLQCVPCRVIDFRGPWV